MLNDPELVLPAKEQAFAEECRRLGYGEQTMAIQAEDGSWKFEILQMVHGHRPGNPDAVMRILEA